MNFHHHVPCEPLRHFISMMWFGDDYVVPYRLERVLPTGEMCLIINLWEDRTRFTTEMIPASSRPAKGRLSSEAYSAFTVIDTDEQRATAGVIF